jgi:hypothetical protein
LANLKNRGRPAPPVRRFQVAAIRGEGESDEQSRFVAKLNEELGRVADEIESLRAGMPDVSDFVRSDELADAIEEIDQTTLHTSEGGDGAGGGGRRGGRQDAREAAAAAIENAAADAAPPKVDDASAVGTTTDPFQFSLEDHTHQGVNLDAAQTITGVKTFNADVKFGATSIWQQSTNRFGIGLLSPGYSLHIDVSSNDGLRVGDSGNVTASIFRLAGGTRDLLQIGGDFGIASVALGTAVGVAATQQIIMTSSQVTVNPPGGDVDFQVQGDTVPNLLFTDAGTEQVGMNNVLYSWPAADAAGALVSDGAGTLVWSSGAGIDHGALDGLGDDDHTQYFLLTGRAGGQVAQGGTVAADDLDLEATSAAWAIGNAGRIRFLERIELYINGGTVTVGPAVFFAWSDTTDYNMNHAFSWYSAFDMLSEFTYTADPFFDAATFFLRARPIIRAGANLSLGGVPIFLNNAQYSHTAWAMTVTDDYGGICDFAEFLVGGAGNYGTSTYNSFRAMAGFADDFSVYNGFRFDPTMAAGDVTEANAFHCSDYGFAAGVTPDPATHVRRSLYSPGANMSLLQTGPSQVKVPSHNREWTLRREWTLGAAMFGTIVGDWVAAGIAAARFAVTTTTFANLEDATGVYADYSTAAAAGSDAYIFSGSLTRRDYEPSFVATFKTGTAITDVRHWIGLFSAFSFGSATPAIHYAAFRYDTGADGTAFWRCVTDSGTGAPTVTTTGVAVATNTRYRFAISMTSTSVYFYINNLLVATHTATLPGAATNLQMESGVRALGAAVRSLRHGGYLMQENI